VTQLKKNNSASQAALKVAAGLNPAQGRRKRYVIRQEQGVALGNLHHLERRGGTQETLQKYF
jgi:hypothetical protein